jgi:hypothetical protein
VQLRTYLVNLTSRRAVHLFTISLACGILFIVDDIGLPWTPALVVCAYGAILLYCAKCLLVPHSEMTNNSPYFLGFLFFLISLLRTFWSVSSLADDLQLGQMVHQLGGALLATVAGLPFRQLLFAYSPSQAEQDIFFRTLEEELRRSATEFKRSQVELIQLIQGFVEARKGIFSEEEEASRQYIRSLQKAVGLFEESAANYPAVISSALSTCAQSLNVLQEKSLELSQAAQTLSPEKIKDIVIQFTAVRDSSVDLTRGLGGLQSAVVQLERLANGLPSSIGGNLRGAQTEFDEIRLRLRRSVNEIQLDVSAIDKVLTDFVVLTQERIGLVR